MKFNLVFKIKLGKYRYYQFTFPVNLVEHLVKASGLSRSELKRLEKNKAIDIWITTEELNARSTTT